MATWSDLSPADTILANTIHTVIQTAKGDIMDRARCNNATFEEHLFFGDETVTGRHSASGIGWVKDHSNWKAINTFISNNNVVDGTLHTVSGSNRLFVSRKNRAILVSSNDHGTLNNIEDSEVHTQYLRVDGSNAMTGNLTLKSTSNFSDDSNTLPRDSGDSGGPGTACSSRHAARTWFKGHKANAVKNSHFEDESIGAANFVTSSYPIIQSSVDYIDLNSDFGTRKGINYSNNKAVNWYRASSTNSSLINAKILFYGKYVVFGAKIATGTIFPAVNIYISYFGDV